MQRAAHQRGRAVGQVAGAAAGDEVGQLLDPADDVRRRAGRTRSSSWRRASAGSAVAARPALSGALARQVSRYPGRLGQPAGCLGSTAQHARAERAPAARMPRADRYASAAGSGSQVPK